MVIEKKMKLSYISPKSSEPIETPSYSDFTHSSWAVTRKNSCMDERFNPGNRAIALEPLIVSIEWYAICIPPELISSSIRLEFENISTAVGTQRIALSSKAFVTERRISFAMILPTVA